MCTEWLFFASKCELCIAAKLTWLFSLGMKQAFKNLFCFFLSVSGVSDTVSISMAILLTAQGIREQKKYMVSNEEPSFYWQAVCVQWAVTMNYGFLHPHPVDGVMLTFTLLSMAFVGGQEFCSKGEPDPFWCLRSGRCERCNVDNEDYNSLIFKSRQCLDYR